MDSLWQVRRPAEQCHPHLLILVILRWVVKLYLEGMGGDLWIGIIKKVTAQSLKPWPSSWKMLKFASGVYEKWAFIPR